MLLGNTDAADDHFADSIRIHKAVRAPFGTAETAYHWGQLLLDRNHEHARTLLSTARQLAGRYGFGDIERRADQTLRTMRNIVIRPDAEASSSSADTAS